ncbi:fumarylacetoacetate hydrolase family protein [Microbacterium invictum]|uniref:Fumarylacetoacetate hydrolase family protein n=1 Tax=Microbacterium invictum TaxID=515415 RepID=A0ABZ0VB22_9MICO|nr:fumarylacetoacetate hydrolase family protein [Microbacterium invictum]WQB70679.1 fumarylacetoacetate hydrolase family protein [Microbacterium invictum]
MDARVEESDDQDVYQRVYEADRPELFFKANAWRTVTDGQLAGIRTDSDSDVPEPELAIALNQHGEIVGYLVCNDMTARAIESQNPIYLPQAKMYAGSCVLSAGIRPAWEVESSALVIDMQIARGDQHVFAGSTSTAQMHRRFDDLIRWLFAAEHFPYGVVLSTGTGIVPPLDFTLQEGDVITIDIPGVGSLRNTVARGPAPFLARQR